MKILKKMHLRKFLRGRSGLKKFWGVGGDFFSQGGGGSPPPIPPAYTY